MLGGKQDIVTKAEASRAIAASALDGRVEIIDEANHMGFLERPEAYNRAISAFATRVSRQASAPSDSPKRARRAPAGRALESERLH